MTENIITDGITARVQRYLISAVPISVSAPAINVSVGATDETVCTNVCEYQFQNTTEMLALYYSVFVIAKNILADGYSESELCSNKTISKTRLICCIAHYKIFVFL